MSNIEIVKGNLFASECQTIVNTVNCVGAMGAGIALEFKYRYPKMFEKYVELCNNRQINIGKLWLYNKEPNRKWVLNFPTKYDWKRPSKIEYLEKGLEKFLLTYKDKGITSIAFPLLGASNGKIPTEVSQNIMIDYLSQAKDIRVEIYQYSPYAKDDLIDIFKEAITYSNPSEIYKSSGLSKGMISKLRNIIENKDVPNMNTLNRTNGIGKSTVAKAYKLAINYQAIPKQSTIFNSISQEMLELKQEIDIETLTKPKKEVDKKEIIRAIDIMELAFQEIQQDYILTQNKLRMVEKEIFNLKQLVK